MHIGKMKAINSLILVRPVIFLWVIVKYKMVMSFQDNMHLFINIEFFEFLKAQSY